MGYGNWIADRNRWNLSAPTDEFLAGLLSFDDHLVIIPSRMSRGYLLARRRQFSAGLGDVAMLDNKHPDTNMLVAHGLVPIAPIRSKTGHPSWSKTDLEGLCNILRTRDAWALSGGPTSETGEAGEQRLIEAVEGSERKAEVAERKNMRENFYHLGREAYRAIAARTGRRNKRASDFHGVARG